MFYLAEARKRLFRGTVVLGTFTGLEYLLDVALIY